MPDAYVIGGGLPELAAALELAEVGLRVRVGLWHAPPEAVEAAAEATAGSASAEGPAAETAAPAAVDAGDPDLELAAARARARAIAGPRAGVLDEHGALRGLLRHLASPVVADGEADAAVEPVETAPAPVLLRGAKGGWGEQPTPAVMGIPAVPVDANAIAVLGGGKAARAYLDRIKPVLTIGKTHELGALVRARLGVAVLDRLVDPFVRERFGVSPDAVDVAIAAPGLNEALTRTGSLTGAVLEQQERTAERETTVKPRGGWSAAMVALRERLAFYDVEFSDRPVRAVARDGDGWRIEEADGAVVGARALVAGIDAGTTAEALDVLPDLVLGDGVAEAAEEASLDALLPTRWRFEARTRVAAESEGAPEQRGNDALQSVRLPDDSHWTVRVLGEVGAAAESATERQVVMRSPSFEMSPTRHGAESIIPDAALDRVLDAAGLARAAGAGATVELQIAPEISTARRSGDLERLEAVRAHEKHFLPVGEALLGADLAAAVADARTRAVLLRRSLTGISD